VGDDLADVLHLFETRLPRLYLDTAVLIEIGDGSIARLVLERLLDAVTSHAVMAVVSLQHLQDALHPGEAENAGRLATALEMFPVLGLVDRGPFEIEPWEQPSGDIVILPCGNIREVINAPSRDATISRHQEVLRASHAGIVTETGMRRVVSAPGAFGVGRPSLRLPARLEPVAQYVVAMMVVAVDYQITDLIEDGATALGVTLSREDREVLGLSLMPALGLLAHLAGELAALSPDERGRVAKSMFATPDRSPGHWLSNQVSGAHRRNILRDPRASDGLDLMHVSHFPYVDVATCDRTTFAAVEPSIRSGIGPRSPRIFRNAELRLLIEHIDAMPVDPSIIEFARTRR